MTDTHSIAQPSDPEVLPSNIRHITVGYASRYPDYRRTPSITMKGQWLEEAGFTTGTTVEMKVMKGCIVLTAQPQESELMQSLRQACKLSARKKKQILEFIKVIAGKQKAA